MMDVLLTSSLRLSKFASAASRGSSRRHFDGIWRGRVLSVGGVGYSNVRSENVVLVDVQVGEVEESVVISQASSSQMPLS